MARPAANVRAPAHDGRLETRASIAEVGSACEDRGGLRSRQADGRRSVREHGHWFALQTCGLAICLQALAACRLPRRLQFVRNPLARAEVHLVRRLTSERRMR